MLGAGYAVSEMLTSRPELLRSPKTSRRMNHDGEGGLVAVQIVGTDPVLMAQTACFNIDKGAQVIDINMGCPAKKVCNKWAGSALMQDEALALSIMDAVVAACEPRGVPVTLKMRTGWRYDQRNASRLAVLAEQAGVQMIAVHGRTREQGYKGWAEHQTVADVKSRVRIPVVVNGDIRNPRQAHQILRATGADAVMVGRAAQGRPWIFRDILHYMRTGQELEQPTIAEVRRWVELHLLGHYHLHGEWAGVRSARKHVGWYVRGLPGGEVFRESFNALESASNQTGAVAEFFDQLQVRMERLPRAVDTVLPAANKEYSDA
jgi:tRNA-dihydrouridine synthase B